jgi:hypothetical protein
MINFSKEQLSEDILNEDDEDVMAEMFAEEAMFLAESQEELDFMLEQADIQALEEAAKFRRKTLVKFNKQDDLTRRTGNAALILGRKLGNRDVMKLDLLREKERALEAKIRKNTSLLNQAQRIAIKAQKQFAKTPTFTDKQQAKSDAITKYRNRGFASKYHKKPND